MPNYGDITNAERQQVPSSLDRFCADDRRHFVQNLYVLSSSHDRALQAAAAEHRERFRAAVAVDGTCWLFGWRLTGFAAADSQPIDDDVLVLTADLEWLCPGSDDFVVRLALGDEPVLSASDDGGENWRSIDVGELGDVLGDWLEELGAAR